MINRDKFDAGWSWTSKNGCVYAIAPNDGDLDMLGYNIVPKRSGKFFVEAYHIGGAKEGLPFAEYKSLEEAKTFILSYEYKRQVDFAKTIKLEW